MWLHFFNAKDKKKKKKKEPSGKPICKSDTESNYNNQNLGRMYNDEGLFWGGGSIKSGLLPLNQT